MEEIIMRILLGSSICAIICIGMLAFTMSLYFMHKFLVDYEKNIKSCD